MAALSERATQVLRAFQYGNRDIGGAEAAALTGDEREQLACALLADLAYDIYDHDETGKLSAFVGRVVGRLIMGAMGRSETNE